MAEQVRETVQGDGWAVGSLDGMGEGLGFRKVRRELGVESMGINAVVLPPGYKTPVHYHEEQEELYFVHEGEIEIVFGEDESNSFRLGPGGFARVAAQTVRHVRGGEEGATYIAIGAKDGYVGRDGRNPHGAQMGR